MINKTLYDKTISILVKAYLNGELVRGNCAACAVGNLVSSNLNISQDEFYFLVNPPGVHEFASSPDRGWPAVFCTNNGEAQKINPDKYIGEAKRQIDSTGYSFLELANIEKAFEENYKGVDKMHGSLMAVVEVLGQIHEVDKEIVEETKLMFVK